MSVRFMLILCLIGVYISHSTITAQFTSDLLLFDFQNANNLDNWSEQSDTLRTLGRSKATFDLYKTKTKQCAILFTLLRPLPNGACFSGVRTMTQLNLKGYNYISFFCKARGNANVYKIILKHNNLETPTFEHKFKVNKNLVTRVKMPISLFKPFYRGRKIDGTVLNINHITSFGIQVAGGVYETFKQKGLSSLEMTKIWATRD